jgi:hypothetical protein
MRKISIYGLVVAACLGTTAMLASGSNERVSSSAGADAHLAADGAYRDGLHLGKLAAEAGQPLRPAIGRWSTEQDRAMFAEGCRRGYSDSLAEEANVTDKE